MAEEWALLRVGCIAALSKIQQTSRARSPLPTPAPTDAPPPSAPCAGPPTASSALQQLLLPVRPQSSMGASRCAARFLLRDGTDPELPGPCALPVRGCACTVTTLPRSDNGAMNLLNKSLAPLLPAALVAVFSTPDSDPEVTTPGGEGRGGLQEGGNVCLVKGGSDSPHYR
jgi:hypothetical protein